jgi:hypothetical protein
MLNLVDSHTCKKEKTFTKQMYEQVRGGKLRQNNMKKLVGR